MRVQGRVRRLPGTRRGHPRRQPRRRGLARRFREKYSLPYTLLADPAHEAADAYGAWGEKTTYGKTSMGIKRSAYVIAPDGSVAKAMYGVKPEGHPEQVLEALPPA